jgi:hypothetical protein
MKWYFSAGQGTKWGIEAQPFLNKVAGISVSGSLLKYAIILARIF